jgi:type II secretory pathway pseudopilin PulG
VALRLRRDSGSLLVELLIALTVLTVGLLTFLGVFTSGTLSLRRAARVSTATTLADGQLELYRSLAYAYIGLDATALAATDTVYRSDSALPGGNVANEITISSGCTAGQCVPSQTKTGGDGKSYRVDTYIVSSTPSGGRALKVVTVVVRDPSNPSATPWIRESSAFDQSAC